MTIARLIEILQALPNQDREIFGYDPFEEVSGEIRDTVQDIIHPSSNKEVYIIIDFG